MNERNREDKASKHPSKMVILAFAPIGAPRNAGRERHYNHCGGTHERLSDRGGEINAW